MADPTPRANTPDVGVGAFLAVAELPTVGEAPRAATRVLVVDDHPVNRMVMRMQLQTLGYAVQDAEGGAEAFARWQSGTFALVLTDLMMPQISGYDLARRIREAEAAAGQTRMPIIACSADLTRGAREACRGAGMDDFVPKPTELSSLGEIMGRWLPAGTGGNVPMSVAANSTAAATRAAPLDPGGGAGSEAAVQRGTLAHFRRINDDDAARLAVAVEQRDLAAIVHLAHRIKGACGFVGATALGAAAASLERAGRAGDADLSARLMQEFASELERLNAYLDEEH